MKNTNICPKCGSKEIYTDSKKAADKRSDRGHIRLSNSAWIVMIVDIHVCTACGYLEEFITEKDLKDPKKLELLKKNWARL